MAIAWGLSRRTSSHHTEGYQFYMQRYLTSITLLFPNYKLKPNHHYALHIPDILLAFGPLHGTWAFSMEHIIGRLQSLNSNSKIGWSTSAFVEKDGINLPLYVGEMEQTALSMFCRRASLIRLVSSPRCPKILRRTWTSISLQLNLPDLDTKVHRLHAGACSLSANPTTLPNDVHAALVICISQFKLPSPSSFKPLFSAEAYLCPQYQSDSGELFSSASHSEAHSLVYYQQDSGELCPGQIRLIFRHFTWEAGRFKGEFYVAIHDFVPIEAPFNNPFSSYPDFRAGIFRNEPNHLVRVRKISSVYCHANSRPWDNTSVVMRAVDCRF
ncbi:hypothetical protein CPB83DRAFT_899994 [Crepidotus variabilis]|uniref:Uncharacterized protein n=1 Tax=Crepidotus variabilis TaxID=179855 RepID=A0A9P6E410_9AGAR|nr:hypothetical protein CPB83DRAFT_899994 [Crepidotus variabilis]